MLKLSQTLRNLSPQKTGHTIPLSGIIYSSRHFFGLYFSLHFGVHTVLEVLRNKPQSIR